MVHGETSVMMGYLMQQMTLTAVLLILLSAVTNAKRYESRATFQNSFNSTATTNSTTKVVSEEGAQSSCDQAIITIIKFIFAVI